MSITNSSKRFAIHEFFILWLWPFPKYFNLLYTTQVTSTHVESGHEIAYVEIGQDFDH